MDAKAVQLLTRSELAIVALRDHISDLLSLFKFGRVEGILEEVEKLLSDGEATKQEEADNES